MQTKLLEQYKLEQEGQDAETILRQCVHCGLCNATCPTYQLLGDERDGPRGRIYLIKHMLEGQHVTRKTQVHLDRCLSCRSCETTCPSGVKYSRLLDIGRYLLDKKVGRSWHQRIWRGILKNTLSDSKKFQQLLHLARRVKPMLPIHLQQKLPDQIKASAWPNTEHLRQVLLLRGCVQPALAPNINAATARVLDALGVQAVEVSQAVCCGAVAFHLDDPQAARELAKKNIDAWWPLIEEGNDKRAERIVMTASGCGVMVKDYGRLLAHDVAYAKKAQSISAMTSDLSEFLPDFETRLIQLIGGDSRERLVWHAPCSLQHGQQVNGKVETLLTALGIDLPSCVDAHLCCGSAGTYSILQSKIAGQLRDQKLQALCATKPERILSANMACQQHLQTGTSTTVQHWIEYLDELLQRRIPENPDSDVDSI